MHQVRKSEFRLGVEVSLRLGDASLFATGFELGARHDGGETETDFGADIGASLSWTGPKRGTSGAFSWNPVEGDRGLRLRLTQTLGGASSGGAEALLGRTTLEGLAAGDDGDDPGSRRLDLEIGYGFGVLDDRWMFIPEPGLGLTDTGRTLRLGGRFVGRVSSGLALELGLEGTRRESGARLLCRCGPAAHRPGRRVVLRSPRRGDARGGERRCGAK